MDYIVFEQFKNNIYKERITAEQLNLLNEKQKNKLRTLWIPTKGDVVLRNKKVLGVIEEYFPEYKIAQIDIHRGIGRFEKEELLPLLSSIQIFDILYDNGIFPNGVTRAFLENLPLDAKKKMCDGLWEKLKEVL